MGAYRRFREYLSRLVIRPLRRMPKKLRSVFGTNRRSDIRSLFNERELPPGDEGWELEASSTPSLCVGDVTLRRLFSNPQKNIPDSSWCEKSRSIVSGRASIRQAWLEIKHGRGVARQNG